MKFEKIIKNKYLYYAACVLAAINLLGYVSQGSMECIIVFGIATYAAHHFTKNRAVDIFAGLFASNVLFGCGRIKEGLTSNEHALEKICADLKSQATCEADKAQKCKWEGAGDKAACLYKAAAAVDEAAAVVDEAAATKGA
jgi:hypothetical protein